MRDESIYWINKSINIYWRHCWHVCIIDNSTSFTQLNNYREHSMKFHFIHSFVGHEASYISFAAEFAENVFSCICWTHCDCVHTFVLLPHLAFQLLERKECHWTITNTIRWDISKICDFLAKFSIWSGWYLQVIRLDSLRNFTFESAVFFLSLGNSRVKLPLLASLHIVRQSYWFWIRY